MNRKEGERFGFSGHCKKEKSSRSHCYKL